MVHTHDLAGCMTKPRSGHQQTGSAMSVVFGDGVGGRSAMARSSGTPGSGTGAAALSHLENQLYGVIPYPALP